MRYEMFERDVPLFAALPGHSPLLRSDLLTSTFRLEHHELGHQRVMDIYYVPFEIVNIHAAVMIVCD